MSQSVFYVVGEVEFEWDPARAAANKAKHCIGFRGAASSFKDVAALLLDDPDHFVDAVRFVLLAYSVKRRMLAVIHVERGARLRIVSARAATVPERKRYEEKR